MEQTIPPFPNRVSYIYLPMDTIIEQSLLLFGPRVFLELDISVTRYKTLSEILSVTPLVSHLCTIACSEPHIPMWLHFCIINFNSLYVLFYILFKLFIILKESISAQWTLNDISNVQFLKKFANYLKVIFFLQINAAYVEYFYSKIAWHQYIPVLSDSSSPK